MFSLTAVCGRRRPLFDPSGSESDETFSKRKSILEGGEEEAARNHATRARRFFGHLAAGRFLRNDLLNPADRLDQGNLHVPLPGIFSPQSRLPTHVAHIRTLVSEVTFRPINTAETTKVL